MGRRCARLARGGRLVRTLARACRCVAAGRDRHNDEFTLGFKDAAAAKRLEEIFEKYAPKCQEIKLEKWRKRGLAHRFVDNAYYLFNEVL